MKKRQSSWPRGYVLFFFTATVLRKKICNICVQIFYFFSIHRGSVESSCMCDSCSLRKQRKVARLFDCRHKLQLLCLTPCVLEEAGARSLFAEDGKLVKMVHVLPKKSPTRQKKAFWIILRHSCKCRSCSHRFEADPSEKSTV